MKRRTISFDDELFEKVEEYRRTKSPIPSFTEAVTEIVEKCLK